jgi:hypothetical protein
MSTRIYNKDPQSVEDRKLLGTVHGMGTVNEYYHARVKTGTQTDFIFLMVRHTKNSVNEYRIDEADLPKNIRPL